MKTIKSMLFSAIVTGNLAIAAMPAAAGEKLLLKTPIAFGSHLPALGNL